jgi:putative phosphoribosyl transferase
MEFTAPENHGEQTVRVRAGRVTLTGDLTVPQAAAGVVLFAHGSGSSRLSPRNRFVAAALNQGGLATLLLDLLTPDEEALDVVTAHLRFDIPLLAKRLVAATDWLSHNRQTQALRLGYFGASTGASAALVAASQRSAAVSAVVSRGGRPDLAGEELPHVQAPTLLIVGGDDLAVLELNQKALLRLTCPNELAVVPHATHLFEEPGALAQVADLARQWFQKHLAGVKPQFIHH